MLRERRRNMPGSSKEKLPVVAIMYDFDRTLCTKDMQEYTFIPSLDESAETFWGKAQKLARKENMDSILAYMYLMVRLSHDKHKPISREVFRKCGSSIKLFPGVMEWFDMINRFGEQQGVKIEHYIISSGLKEIIEGNPIADRFSRIYACEFHYDENGMADWPKLSVNYTNKTQFLFRINKGLLDIGNDRQVNRYVPEELRPVPFRNMIYIGDGMTDVPCMKLVKVNGGQSIAVYQKHEVDTVRTLLTDNRVNYIARADYREGKEIDLIVRDIIIKMAAVSRLNRRSEKARSI